MEIKRFRKKPVEVDAMQWDGTAAGAGPIINWMLGNGGTARYHDVRDNPLYIESYLAIDTSEKTILALGGDWIIRTEDRKFYPIKPGQMDEEYEAVE